MADTNKAGQLAKCSVIWIMRVFLRDNDA